MAYAVTYGRSGQSRIGSLAMVALIHAGIGAVLVTGMSVDVIPPLLPERLVGQQIDAEPEVIVQLPPPEPAKPAESAADIHVPPSVIAFDPGPLVIPGPPLDPAELVLPNPAGLIPKVEPVPPAPAAVPQAARPRGDRSGWITNDDYRPSWIRQEMEGTASYVLTVDPDGRVAQCRITGSSGHPQLDKATCDNLRRRARFEPATDGAGARVGGSYSGSVVWRIPE